jgi:hypothetical protein
MRRGTHLGSLCKRFRQKSLPMMEAWLDWNRKVLACWIYPVLLGAKIMNWFVIGICSGGPQRGYGVLRRYLHSLRASSLMDPRKATPHPPSTNVQPPQRVKFNDRRDLLCKPNLEACQAISKPRCLGQDPQQQGT